MFNVRKEMLFCDKCFSSGITQPELIVTTEPAFHKPRNLLSALNLPKFSNLDHILPQLPLSNAKTNQKISFYIVLSCSCLLQPLAKIF